MKTFASFALLALLLPSRLLAQDPSDDRKSHFGVIVTFSPTSDVRNDFKVLFDTEQINVRSKDFEIGFVVRGRQLGGDWGVSYVQKTYENGSFIDDTIESCFAGPCLRYGFLDIMRTVRLRGVAIHKFAPFVTIKRRAQIGLNFGGGVAKARGLIERHEFDRTGEPAIGEVAGTDSAAPASGPIRDVRDIKVDPVNCGQWLRSWCE